MLSGDTAGLVSYEWKTCAIMMMVTTMTGDDDGDGEGRGGLLLKSLGDSLIEIVEHQRYHDRHSSRADDHHQWCHHCHH